MEVGFPSSGAKTLNNAVVGIWDITSRDDAYFGRGKNKHNYNIVVRLQGENKLLGAKFLHKNTHTHKHTFIKISNTSEGF